MHGGITVSFRYSKQKPPTGDDVGITTQLNTEWKSMTPAPTNWYLLIQSHPMKALRWMQKRNKRWLIYLPKSILVIMLIWEWTLSSLEWIQTESKGKHKDRLGRQIMWVQVPSNRDIVSKWFSLVPGKNTNPRSWVKGVKWEESSCCSVSKHSACPPHGLFFLSCSYLPGRTVQCNFIPAQPLLGSSV